VNDGFLRFRPSPAEALIRGVAAEVRLRPA